MLSLTRDVWLSEIMAQPVHRVSVNGEANLAIDSPRGFYFGRIPAADIRTANALAALGFRVVDTGVTLERDPRVRASGGRIAVRAAVPQDREAVAAIARHGFRFSRFHLDPQIPSALANEIKAQWAENFFRGRRGDQMAVAEIAGRPVGFLQLLRAGDGTLVIDLIAVEDNHRGAGIGSAMVEWAAGHAGGGRMRVGTQAANVGSLRFYENLGFRTVATAYVMHLHA
ncbi:MAG TPA: GNAT family N-acetyltransferase [Pseudolabrys sp.]|nr:GNAT family N-acetyltransferase [Pseudolabrys sp.]